MQKILQLFVGDYLAGGDYYAEFPDLITKFQIFFSLFFRRKELKGGERKITGAKRGPILEDGIILINMKYH